MELVWDILLLSNESKAQVEYNKNDQLGYVSFSIDSNKKKFVVETNFIAILNPQTPLEVELNKVIKLIRAKTKSSSCGNKNFYGL
jgi:hypothetical protein